jgi:hypothetical protein
MQWIIGIVVALGVAIGGLQWALRSHRNERRPWLDLLATSAMDGIAEDGCGMLRPIAAPFTGRPCLAFAIDIVIEEHFGNEITWHRVFTDGAGEMFVRGHRVDLAGARTIFPTPLENYGKLSLHMTNETVFRGAPQQMPPHLVGFVQRLDPETQTMIWRPSGQLIGGKRVYFNERIVLPGQPVVVAGQDPVAIAHGTVASERARVAKLPVGGELFGAIMAGGLAFAFVQMMFGIFSGR